VFGVNERFSEVDPAIAGSVCLTLVDAER